MNIVHNFIYATFCHIYKLIALAIGTYVTVYSLGTGGYASALFTASIFAVLLALGMAIRDEEISNAKR